MDIETKHGNQDIDIDLNLSINANPYSLCLAQRSFKNIGTYNITQTQAFYMGNNDTINDPAKITFLSDYDTDVYIKGWYISVIRR